MSTVPADPDDFDERMTRTGQALEAAAQPLGLYLTAIHLSQQDQTPDVILVATFNLGAVAFTDRVQHPGRYAEDDKVRLAIAEADLDDPTDMLREQWKGLLGGGSDGGDRSGA